jgi:thymidylate synthase
MKINPNIQNINDFTYEDFTIEWYDPHGILKWEIANIGGF